MYTQWSNPKDDGAVVFATTTILDFAPVFRSRKMAYRMCRLLIEDAAFFDVILHAYVVMPEHIYLRIRLPVGKTISQFMHSLKLRSGMTLLPLCSPSMKSRPAEEGTKDQRGFWKRSFRSVLVENEKAF